MNKRISNSAMLVVLLVAGARCFGQAQPTATAAVGPTPAAAAGPRLSWIDGTVHYALNATELIQTGYYGGGVSSTTALSGNVGYVTMNQTHPFSLLFAGGVLIGQAGQGASTYQNFVVAQSLIKGKWVLGVNDSFSFLPQSPTTGISGIAGVGQLGTLPIQGPSAGPAGGVLTYSGNRIGNTLGGEIERRLTGRTSLSGSAMWSVLHFLDKRSGLDTSSTTGQVGINHRINLRNSVSLSAVYSTYDTTGLFANQPGFPTDGVAYQTKGLNASYQRQWTRALSTDISAGPQWISSSAAQIVPARLNVYVNAGLDYSHRLTNYDVHFTHGVNSGSGVYAGAEADSVSMTVGHSFGREWAASAWVDYTRTTGLLVTSPGYPLLNTGVTPNGAIVTEYGTLQVMHAFTRTISGYLSYSAQNQDVNSSLASQNVFSGLSHTVGIGVSWTPQSTRLGDF